MSDIAEIGFVAHSDSLVVADDRLNKLPASAAKAEAATDKFNKKADQSKKSLDNLASGAAGAQSALLKLAGGIAAAFSVQALINYTNIWTDLNSRVEIATGSIGAGADTMERLGEMARRTYSSLELTAESFLKNATAMSQLGYSTKQTLDYVEAINNALVVSGAKGERAESVLNALGKAMALGKLSGDNLETVLSSGGRVALALADSLNTTNAGLRKMGAEGKLTGDILYKGLTSQLETLRKEADSMPATIGDAFVLLGNSILTQVGKFDQLTGASSQVAESIIFVADNMEMFIPIVTGVSTALLVATGVVLAAIPAVQAFTVALLTNPLVLFGAALGVLVGWFVQTQVAAAQTSKDIDTFSKAVDTNEASLTLAANASGAFRSNLKAQIEMQHAAAGAALAEADAQVQAAKAKVLSMQAAHTGGLFDLFGGKSMALIGQEGLVTELMGKATALDKTYVALEVQLNKITDVTTKLGGATGGVGAGLDTVDKKAQKAADAYKKIVTGANEYIAAQQLEAQSLGMSALQANNLRYAQELLNKATADGKSVSATQRNELLGLASDMALAQQATENLTYAYNLGKETLGSFFSDTKAELMNGTSLWGAFAQAGVNALGSIADKALSMAANGIWDMIFNSATGNASSSGGKDKSGSGNIFSTIGSWFGFADGGYTGSGGTGAVAGMVHGQEYVLNADATRRIGVSNLDALNDNQMSLSGSGGTAPVSVLYAPVTHFNGLGLTFDEVQQLVLDSEARQRAELPDALNEIRNDPYRRKSA